MAPIATNPDTTPEDVTDVTPQAVSFEMTIAIAPEDEATLAAGNAILTLTDKITIPGVIGSFYVSLSKATPHQV